jgi:hypothetical protein
MTDYPQGTVLKCGHGDCGCRVRVESECHCSDTPNPYVCTCGVPMVVVTEESAG